MGAMRGAFVAAAVLLGCSGGSESRSPTETTCAEVCAAVYACAASFGYGLADTLGTQGDCVTGCESRTCGPTYAARVKACIASVPCTGALDVWGATVVACDTDECAYGLPVPVGACNDQGAAGVCGEALGVDAASMEYGEAYCTNVAHGTWVATCPAESRKAVCLYEYGTFGRIVYYTSYAGDLEAAEAACRQIPGFRSWTTY